MSCSFVCVVWFELYCAMQYQRGLGCRNSVRRSVARGSVFMVVLGDTSFTGTLKQALLILAAYTVILVLFVCFP